MAQTANMNKISRIVFALTFGEPNKNNNHASSVNNKMHTYRSFQTLYLVSKDLKTEICIEILLSMSLRCTINSLKIFSILMGMKENIIVNVIETMSNKLTNNHFCILCP